jgi:Bax protein
MDRFQKILLLILLLGSSFLISACERSAFSWPAAETDTIARISPASHRDLSDHLAVNSYSWDNLDQGVPPFLLTALPKDLHRIQDITKRKQLFFLSLLPSVLLANREITLQRRQFLTASRHYQAGLPLSAPQQLLIKSLVKNYRLRHNPLTHQSTRKQLLQRLDILPPDLVLAQAANESGYGSSRFARLGNSLFGQWTYATGTGLVPKERSANQRHEVQRFASLYDSVRSYMNNLNAHRAYRSLRTIRAQKRSRKQALRGTDLAAGLRLYSSRRDAYVAEIRAIIRSNRLSRLTSVSLRPAAANDDAINTASL